MADYFASKPSPGPPDGTVRRHFSQLRRFFAVAVEKGLVRQDPFVHGQIKATMRGNPDRRQFIRGT